MVYGITFSCGRAVSVFSLECASRKNIQVQRGQQMWLENDKKLYWKRSGCQESAQLV